MKKIHTEKGKTMNIIKLMTPKISVTYLSADEDLASALGKMRSRGFSIVPVVSSEGKCVGSLSEGDCLSYILDHSVTDLKALENVKVKSVMNKKRNPTVKIDISPEELYEQLTGQNFAPVTDDRGAFIGIVTRRAVLNHYRERLFAEDSADKALF